MLDYNESNLSSTAPYYFSIKQHQSSTLGTMYIVGTQWALFKSPIQKVHSSNDLS